MENKCRTYSDEVGVVKDKGFVIQDIDGGFSNPVKPLDGLLHGAGASGARHSGDGEHRLQLGAAAGRRQSFWVGGHRRVVGSGRCGAQETLIANTTHPWNKL